MSPGTMSRHFGTETKNTPPRMVLVLFPKDPMPKKYIDQVVDKQEPSEHLYCGASILKKTAYNQVFLRRLGLGGKEGIHT